MTRAVREFSVVVVGLGALGAATTYQLAARGVNVLGIEQFELGHSRGASHDTSRILRHSYHTANYVRLTKAAYDDWTRLEAASGQTLVSVVGGLDLFPPGGVIEPTDYTSALASEGIEWETLSGRQIRDRWPLFQVADDVVGLYQGRGAIVPAGRGTAVMHELARQHSAVLWENQRVLAVEPHAKGYRVVTATDEVLCAQVVLTADAWINQLLAQLGVNVPLTVTEEQVTYYEIDDLAAYQTLPLWIWMDDPCFYGFPPYGEASIKAAQDCGGPVITPDSRSFAVDRQLQETLTRHVHSLLPGVGAATRSLRCQYTLTHDRDFVLAEVPGHDGIFVGLGAAHGFKFAPTIGRLLSELVLDGQASHDLTPYGFDRPAIIDPDYAPQWMV